MTTAAYRLRSILRDIDSRPASEEWAADIAFLDDHAYAWARKYRAMSHLDARLYAAWFVGEHGGRWVTECDGPNHFDAHKVYALEMVS